MKQSLIKNISIACLLATLFSQIVYAQVENIHEQSWLETIAISPKATSGLLVGLISTCLGTLNLLDSYNDSLPVSPSLASDLTFFRIGVALITVSISALKYYKHFTKYPDPFNWNEKYINEHYNTCRH